MIQGYRYPRARYKNAPFYLDDTVDCVVRDLDLVVWTSDKVVGVKVYPVTVSVVGEIGNSFVSVHT